MGLGNRILNAAGRFAGRSGTTSGTTGTRRPRTGGVGRTGGTGRGGVSSGGGLSGILRGVLKRR